MSTMNIYDMADAWNDAGTVFTAIKMDVTDTASGAGSLLMDLQRNGVSKFRVTKEGTYQEGEPTLSSELVSNGDFDADLTGWTGTNWAWESDGAGGGRARHTPGSTSNLLNNIGGNYVAGIVYRLRFTVGGLTAGSITPKFNNGDWTGIPVTANGDYEYFTILHSAHAGLGVIFTPTSDFDGYVDRVSLTTYVPEERTIYATEKHATRVLLPDGQASTFPSYPVLAGVNSPKSGWQIAQRGSWFFYRDGNRLMEFTDEGSTAPMIKGWGSNRFTIESNAALVLRSLNNHIEFESQTGAGGTHVEIVPYRGGTATGIPLIFRTDAGTPSARVVIVRSVAGRNDDPIFAVQNSSESDTITATGNGHLTAQTMTLANLPTSDPAIAGQLWNDSGTLKVSAGL